MKIVVIDDSPVMRKLIARSIRLAGYGDAELVEAEDGSDVIDVVEQQEPDLIVADWNMSNPTGIEMLGALRADGNPVAVGFVTVESSIEVRKQAREAGAAFFLPKPIDTARLGEALTAVGD